MQNEWAIDVTGLKKAFNDRIVVNSIDLHVKKGEVFAFLGPNGSGKTTTIRMLCGLLTPDAGNGSCLGYDILTESFKIKTQVGYMTQRYSFYEDLSVEENLSFIAKVYHIPNSKDRIQTLMQQMGLTERRHQLTGQLSGGWKQRVALTACLLHNPSLLLLDEPTSGVDPIARRIFWDTIHKLSEQGITTLVSTHYMEEALYCTRLAYLAHGQLIVTGTVNEVIAASGICSWDVKGPVTTTLLQEIKKISGVEQATLFNDQIHICGTAVDSIEKGLAKVIIQQPSLSFNSVNPTLEDAFIALVKQTQGELN